MGVLRDSLDSRSGAGAADTGASSGQPPLPAPPAAAPPAAAGPAAQPSGAEAAAEQAGRSDLRRRRDELAEAVTELHWDLGGLAYEMAIRDHFRLDVLVRRAAMLQERDAELAEVERLLRMEEDGVAGTCPTCAAPHSRGALFCWQCGTRLMERVPSSSVPDGGESTAVMDALLPGAGGQEPARGAAAE